MASEKNQTLEVVLSEVQIFYEGKGSISFPADLPEKDEAVFMAAISIQEGLIYDQRYHLYRESLKNAFINGKHAG
jgi:hypothetical protein